VVLASLSLVWLYCLNLQLGRSRFESFLAAAILGCSWEVAYHSRWIAPDAVMMQFALLSFLCLAVGMQKKGSGWFYLGAISIGLTTGMKYTGAIVLLFFLAGVAWTLVQERQSIGRIGKTCLGLIGTTILTFVITTPGAVIDPFRFVEGVND